MTSAVPRLLLRALSGMGDAASSSLRIPSKDEAPPGRSERPFPLVGKQTGREGVKREPNSHTHTTSEVGPKRAGARAEKRRRRPAFCAHASFSGCS